ncbi:hypothetical protein HOY82DRAFT_641056 [Tuber indicum]|nr:hypothetical protein HOY82DRAFT_641056 [Tuber indicum]
MKRGNINSDVYVASALIEYHCYKHPAALKIFGRGRRIFPDDENFVLEYLKFLVAINNITKTRAVLEAFVARIHWFLDPRADMPIKLLMPARQFALCQPHNSANQNRKPYLHRISTILPETAVITQTTRCLLRVLSDFSEYPKLTKRHQPDSPMMGAAGYRRNQPRAARQQQHLSKSRKRNSLDLHDATSASITAIGGSRAARPNRTPHHYQGSSEYSTRTRKVPSGKIETRSNS